MASSSAGPSLAHRSVATIRGSATGRDNTLANPHTPARPLSSSIFGSPSTARAEEDVIVVELGCRKLRVGFAGDPTPKRVITFDADEAKRPGDYRAWEAGYKDEWRKRTAGRPWGSEHELWQLDVRGQDLGLVGDRLERALRDTFARYLLIDSKPRRMSLVLPPAIPLPLLSYVLDTIFHSFQPPTISLLSSPVMATFAAGVRSALVVDMGWYETTVTAVYEYREVQTWRTTRAGKMLLEETRNFLVEALEGRPAPEGDREPAPNDVISFEECEEVATRMLWCRKPHKGPRQVPSEGLPTLHEQDESETPDPTEDSTPMPIHLSSCQPPRTLQIPFSRLAEPCETTFFPMRYAAACFDDHELPLHLLVYRSLLQLPLDVRAMCMSRITFTGGASNIIGVKGRLFGEVRLLAQERGWDPIQGKGVEAYKKNPKLRRSGSRQANEGPVPVIQTSEDVGTAGADEAPRVRAADAPQEADQVEELIRKEKDPQSPAQGMLRALDSMGPWCGASLAAQLKVPALATVERDQWLLQGVNGAVRPGEIDVQTQQRQQRQSMGSGGLIRGQGSQANNWTLGVWGTV